MGKLMYITEGHRTHRNCTWFRKPWSPGKGLWRSLIHACSAPPSAPALGHWARTVGQASLWPDLGCSAWALARPRFFWGLCRVPWHPALGVLVVRQLLFHLPRLWWTYPGCSSCVYTTWFLNRSIHFVLLLSPYFQDKRSGNNESHWYFPMFKVCRRCLGSQNEPARKGNIMGWPACTAPGHWAQSLQTTGLKFEDILKDYSKDHGRQDMSGNTLSVEKFTNYAMLCFSIIITMSHCTENIVRNTTHLQIQ